MDEYLEALDERAEKSAHENAKFIADYRRDTKRWKPEPEDEEFLRLITTGRISGRPLLSNRYVHGAAQRAMAAALPREYEKFPNRQYLWITLACDIGLTWEREPFIDFVALRNTFYQHLNRCGLAGVGVIETDTWKNLPGEPGRRMVPHAHCVCWPECGEPVGAAALQAELCGRRALTNSLGALPAVVKQINATTADFARVGRYMLKRPAYAKIRLPNLDDDRFHLEGREHALGSVARLVEIFSYAEVGDVIFSIGKGGKPIADAIRRAAAKEVKSRSGAKPAPTRDQIMQHWHQIRLINGNPNFRECRIITRTDQR